MIDPILSQWAEKHSLHWYSEYQDTAVRTFYLNPEKRDRIQVSVDAPEDGKTVVRVGQLRKGLSRLSRRVEIPTALADLAPALDEALKIANDWLAEGDN
ncbi:hypothetical protein [Caulobacter sp. 17J80-11]|uniref:hypothetical protein n=1 Tax=Caulobacter sp. 17J80-11 TaxID=2763502 RepID=UPI001653616C|nr:hypothetical protein [Caulobacter sp. 17J80-11]MBC6981397.1 hypothetical protein [Caulobacter sp. 17J80-11]